MCQFFPLRLYIPTGLDARAVAKNVTCFWITILSFGANIFTYYVLYHNIQLSWSFLSVFSKTTIWFSSFARCQYSLCCSSNWLVNSVVVVFLCFENNQIENQFETCQKTKLLISRKRRETVSAEPLMHGVIHKPSGLFLIIL